MSQMPFNPHSLVSTLQNNSNLPVVFSQDGQFISPGYHITEVKMSEVNSLDCGQGTDQWRELAIQLLDGNAAPSAAFMPSAKMLGILDKALDNTQIDDNTKLYFEFASGNTAVQKSTVESIEIIDGAIAITLVGTTAQCKPYQRALSNGTASADGGGCCTSVQSTSRSCCGS